MSPLWYEVNTVIDFRVDGRGADVMILPSFLTVACFIRMMKWLIVILLCWILHIVIPLHIVELGEHINWKTEIFISIWRFWSSFIKILGICVLSIKWWNLNHLLQGLKNTSDFLRACVYMLITQVENLGTSNKYIYAGLPEFRNQTLKEVCWFKFYSWRILG